jgi:two-component system response regulator YesN
MHKVLLVDDETFIVEGLKILINWEALGYTVAATANNGAQAIEYLTHNRVDIIVSDIKMPLMSGIELFDALRRHNLSSAYFVILSGYGEFEYAQMALRLGCIDYILKPVTAAELTAVLRRAALVCPDYDSDDEEIYNAENAPATETIVAETTNGNCGADIVLLTELEIKKNFRDSITLKSLADKYFVNSIYLGQLFKKKYGLSFKTYLNNIRIEEAAKLLVSTNRKVGEIAVEVGYVDVDYFTKKFIALKGCTPVKFRRN